MRAVWDWLESGAAKVGLGCLFTAGVSWLIARLSREGGVSYTLLVQAVVEANLGSLQCPRDV